MALALPPQREHLSPARIDHPRDVSPLLGPPVRPLVLPDERRRHVRGVEGAVGSLVDGFQPELQSQRDQRPCHTRDIPNWEHRFPLHSQHVVQRVCVVDPKRNHPVHPWIVPGYVRVEWKRIPGEVALGDGSSDGLGVRGIGAGDASVGWARKEERDEPAERGVGVPLRTLPFSQLRGNRHCPRPKKIKIRVDNIRNESVIPHIEMVGVHNNHPSHIRRRLGVEALSCGGGGSWRGWWPRGRVRGKWAARAAQFPPQYELLPPPRLWSIVHSGHNEREIALGDLFNAEVEAVAAAGSRAACFAIVPVPTDLDSEGRDWGTFWQWHDSGPLLNSHARPRCFHFPSRTASRPAPLSTRHCGGTRGVRGGSVPAAPTGRAEGGGVDRAVDPTAHPAVAGDCCALRAGWLGWVPGCKTNSQNQHHRHAASVMSTAVAQERK
eukprot:m.474505 g.474505  ORF g.474505 m.474505 type:complete len:437 (+) comp36357_c0_seq1:1987-3297(+)